MTPRFRDLVRAAFNARPFGMVVPPNWIGLAAFGCLGLANPGFWLIGAGLELGYLATLVTNARFHRLVAARRNVDSQGAWAEKLGQVLAHLEPGDRARYERLAVRCRAIVGEPVSGVNGAALEAQGQGLARLGWVYLRLLATRGNVERVLRGAGDDTRDATDAGLGERLQGLRRRLDDETVDDELRRSLAGQADILEQRIARRRAARDTVAYVEAELTRIEEQVELLREQAVLETDPDGLSRRLDEIIAGLGGTTRWISEQQQVYGSVEDLLTEPPPLTGTRAVAKESQ